MLTDDNNALYFTDGIYLFYSSDTFTAEGYVFTRKKCHINELLLAALNRSWYACIFFENLNKEQFTVLQYAYVPVYIMYVNMCFAIFLYVHI